MPSSIYCLVFRVLKHMLMESHIYSSVTFFSRKQRLCWKRLLLRFLRFTHVDEFCWCCIIAMSWNTLIYKYNQFYLYTILLVEIWYFSFSYYKYFWAFLMYMCESLFIQVYVWHIWKIIFLGNMPRYGMIGIQGKCIFSFTRRWRTVFSSGGKQFTLVTAI